MARFSHTINMAIFWLFLLLAIVLSLANWGIILFSIADTVIIHWHYKIFCVNGKYGIQV